MAMVRSVPVRSLGSTTPDTRVRKSERLRSHKENEILAVVSYMVM